MGVEYGYFMCDVRSAAGGQSMWLCIYEYTKYWHVGVNE